MQQLNPVTNAPGIQIQHFAAANSQIEDANIVGEVVYLTRKSR